MSNIGMESGHASAEPSKAVLEKAAEWIVRLNDPAVTEGDFIAWQAWLGESAAHAQAFQECQDTWNRSASVLQLSPVVPSGMQGMRTELAVVLERSMRRRKTALRWLAIAATIVVASVGVVIWRTSSSVVETATAELRSVRLPDGSRAALGPETRLEIDFSERSRSLTMTSGEAYFEVVHAPERPFSVDTPAGRVIAVGTAFSVNASPDRVAVAVAQGVVRVDSPGNADPTASTVVSAGHRFIRDHAHTNIETLASPADAVAWQAGSLE